MRYCGWVERMETTEELENNVKKICDFVLDYFYENYTSSNKGISFPKNYCEDASIVLNRLLNENNIFDFNLIKGIGENNEMHFWLESDTHVVDLTAHQFDGFDTPLILIKKTDYLLYKKFNNQNVWDYINDASWPHLDQLFYRMRSKFFS